MSRRWKIAAICGILCLCVAMSAEHAAFSQELNTGKGKSYVLTYKFIPNQSVHYEVVHEMEIINQLNEQTETSRNKSESRKHYRVLAVEPDGSGNLELIIDRVHMTASVGGKPAEVFKSDDAAAQPEKYKHILRTVGKPQATIRFSPAGAPLKVAPILPVAANQPAVAGGSANGQEASPESYLTPLPEQPVAVGDIWKERFQLDAVADKLPVKITMQREYRLAAVEANRALIEFRTVILTPVHDPAISAQLIQRETQGKIVFDLARGQVVSRDVGIDRTVINPFGSKSSMRAVSRYQERLITP